jgi:hypothetical protein
MTSDFSSMKLPNLTYSGAAISDPDIINEAPEAYRRLLRQVNGFIAFDGGLHIRGAVKVPKWHSLRGAWKGDLALHKLFPELTESDIPFGQDYLGDQFILRDGTVFRMNC